MNNTFELSCESRLAVSDMSDSDSATMEADLWRLVVEAQQAYQETLARLDQQAVYLARGNPPTSKKELLDQAAETRCSAYTKYREAINNLADYLNQ